MLPLAFIVAAAALFGLAWAARAWLHYPALPHPHTLSVHDWVSVLQLVFASVAGAGALVALIVAYRRQRVAEADAVHDRTRVFNERFIAIAAQLGDHNAGGVAVHPGAAAVEQDRPAGAGADRAVDSAPDRWWQWDQDDLGAFAAHAQHPVAVFFAEVGDVGAGGFEDTQAEQPEHDYQREVERVRRFPGSGEQCLELQVGKPQGRRFRWDGGPADVLGG